MDPKDIDAAIRSCEDRIKNIKSVPDYQPGKRQRARAIELEKIKISALHPITREQLEKVWTGCDCNRPKSCCTCSSMRCQYCIGQSEYKQSSYCLKCGRPLTEEAWLEMMQRLEKLNDEESRDKSGG